MFGSFWGCKDQEWEEEGGAVTATFSHKKITAFYYSFYSTQNPTKRKSTIILFSVACSALSRDF